jgi:hypothetical protein
LATLCAAGCASLPVPDERLEAQVGAVLERRGLGRDALSVIDNVLRHGAPAPRATPALVLERLANPLAAANVSNLFRRSVPAALASLDKEEGRASFDALLRIYLDELAEAQRRLRAATRPFDDDVLIARLAEGLPSANQMLAVADSVDFPQLEQANARFIEATLRFVRRLNNDFPAEPQKFESAIGLVVIGTQGNDRHGPEAALIIDPGGDDVYERVPARGGAVSVIVDLAGNDRYLGSDVALRALSAIVDFSGDDRYAMDGPGLAAAIAGAALLIDYAGNDSYEAKFLGQGAAAFGIGALVDLAGDDRYQLRAWGQGLGLAQGLGLLWDRAGDDRYAAAGETDPFERGSGLSGAQGAAFGFRDLIGGGIGILRDDAGDDRYTAQMFAQGLGYYYGLGLLWDLGGKDAYQAFRYAQGNGVHQAIGVLRDEAGDDRYAIALGYGQGMGLDLGVGTLVDGAGDDSYRAHYGAQGAATANGFGLLADRGGADRFAIGPDEHAWGRADWLRGLPSVGVLLHGARARFERDGKSISIATDNFAVTHEAAPARCRPDTAWSFDEALLCLLRDAPEPEAAAMWHELQELVVKEPELAPLVAMALGVRPPTRDQAARIAGLLHEQGNCAVRALSLRAWPTLAAAQAGLRSSCWRLQAAARAALARLGAPLPADVVLPTFLRGPAVQEEAF